MKKEKNVENKKDNSAMKWFITVFITTFILSILFSYISTTAINGLAIIPAIIILIIVILVGIVFDIVGVAVTVGEESHFHAKASKKITGAKTSIKLIRNSAKVANICADVIGDICGVLSGSISALVTLKITEKFGLAFDIQFIISEGEVYIIEVNPRSSRTVPYISKVTNLPMIDIATNVILGKKLKDLGL